MSGPASDGELLRALAEIVGPRDVLSDADLRSGFETDWTGRWHGQSAAVVRPADAGELASVLRCCGELRVDVIPQGGNTGLVGGATPNSTTTRPQIVLTTSRLDRLGEVDRATRQVSVGAGVTLAALQRLAAPGGLDAGLDLAARDSATVGGLAACDAGGMRAVRYGTARRRITGIEAVLANGAIVSRMSGLIKDNAGYDLGSLLIGSEGTLGVITQVRWSLVARPAARAVALVALRSVADAVELTEGLLGSLASLELIELIDEAGARLALDHLSVPAPVPLSAAWLLLECAADDDPEDELTHALDRLGVTEAGVIAADAAGRDRLLRIRECQAEAIARVGIPHKLDVGVPLHRLGEFHARLGELIGEVSPDARPVVFGHLGDGNLHVNILGPDPADESVDDAVLRLAAECGGTISAEHGVGRHKPRYLPLVRSAPELHAMRAIKRALDPNGILNPGVLLSPDPER